MLPFKRVKQLWLLAVSAAQSSSLLEYAARQQPNHEWKLSQVIVSLKPYQ